RSSRRRILELILVPRSAFDGLWTTHFLAAASGNANALEMDFQMFEHGRSCFWCICCAMRAKSIQAVYNLTAPFPLSTVLRIARLFNPDHKPNFLNRLLICLK